MPATPGAPAVRDSAASRWYCHSTVPAALHVTAGPPDTESMKLLSHSGETRFPAHPQD